MDIKKDDTVYFFRKILPKECHFEIGRVLEINKDNYFVKSENVSMWVNKNCIFQDFNDLIDGISSSMTIFFKLNR